MTPPIGDTLDANHLVRDTVENMIVLKVFYQHGLETLHKVKNRGMPDIRKLNQ